MAAAIAFAVIGGYADAIGFLRYHAFAGMMTGNTVLMGLALFRRADLPAWDYAGLLAIFFLAAVAAFLLLRYLPPVLLLIGEAVLILLADVFGGAAWAAIFLVAAMGIQNPVGARFGLAINTTFITGDILRFAEGLTRRRGDKDPAVREGFAIFGWVWLAYALGAALGVAAFRLVESGRSSCRSSCSASSMPGKGSTRHRRATTGRDEASDYHQSIDFLLRTRHYGLLMLQMCRSVVFRPGRGSRNAAHEGIAGGKGLAGEARC